MIELKCTFCGKTIKKFPNQIRKNNFCSSKCYHLFTRQINEIYYELDYAYILLTKDNITKKVLFDIDDVDKIKKYKWHLHLRKKDMRYDVCTNTYGNHKNRKYINMPRFLLNCSNNLSIDHINHNTLDNRKVNLKICTTYENNQNKRNNKSGCVGVCWDKTRQKWRVMINKKNIGRFDNFDEAVKARKEAEKFYHLQNNV